MGSDMVTPGFAVSGANRLLASIVFFSLLAAPVCSVTCQSVLLRIRPNVGDTLRMQMDQTFEILPNSKPSLAGEKSRKDGKAGEAAQNALKKAMVGNTPLVANVSVCTRSVVISRSDDATVLESITDSVSVTPESAAGLPLFANVKQLLHGKPIRLNVALDGGITIPGKSQSQAESGMDTPVSLSALHMPALLPAGPVSVGDTWVREMKVPVGTGTGDMGLVQAKFKFDSLSRDEQMAYISMSGKITHAQLDRSGKGEDSTVGTLNGTMHIDRKLGWVTDSRATMSFSTTVRPARGAAPMRVDMKVSQWLRAIPLR